MNKRKITVWITALIMVVSMAGQSVMAFGAVGDSGNRTVSMESWKQATYEASVISYNKISTGKADKNGAETIQTSAKTASSKTVYITKTGKKFHKNGCRHLSRSKIAIKKSKAVARGYKACKICRP